ncbi:transposase [Mesorhizobium sp. ANAO-SY3R2]|uniref:transposase n=1 Tax=Mesorhizobium sp. ANAO-SY3R2 TaxID=3166644 RepID=UPI003672C297
MTGTGNFNDDFKGVAAAQITEWGYPVAEVSQRLGVSQHSLYVRNRMFSKPSGAGDVDLAAELRRLKKELARVTEERGILQNRPRPTARLWLQPSSALRQHEVQRPSEPVDRSIQVDPTSEHRVKVHLGWPGRQQIRPGRRRTSNGG